MPFYCFLTLFACGVTSIVLSVVLAGVKIRKDESLTKYRTAHWFLCAALLFYGLSNFFQISLEDAQEETLSGLLMITVGSLQAMMFTMVVLIFIRPAVVTLRNVSVQFTIIALLSAFLFFAHFTFPPSVYTVIFRFYIAAYVTLLAIYTYIFLKSYKVFRKQMMDYYEEEELLYRTRRIKWIFWSALAVGIMALLLNIDSHHVNMLFTSLFTAYFILVTISYINYQQYAQLIVHAYDSTTTQQDTPQKSLTPEEADELKTRIHEWVRQKKFAETDKSVDEIAAELGTKCNTLREYFTNCVGEDFRSWRNRIRIEEAKRLIDANPSMKITEVMAQTGFNDRPYFYRIFTKIAGTSLADYRKDKAERQLPAKS